MDHVKAIIFDCDGALVDSEHAHYTSWRTALQKQGRDFSVEEYYCYVGRPTEVIAKALSQIIGKECAQQLVKDKLASFFSLQSKGLPPIRHTVDFMHRLIKEKERFNLKLGLASAACKEEIYAHLTSLGIRHLFDVILSGQDDLEEYQDVEGVNKPKPYVYLHAAKLLNVMPSECVVIEDSCSGVTAGSSAGCITIAVPNSYSKAQDFSLADFKIESFAGMDVEMFLNRVKELLVSRTH